MHDSAMAAATTLQLHAKTDSGGYTFLCLWPTAESSFFSPYSSFWMPSQRSRPYRLLLATSVIILPIPALVGHHMIGCLLPTHHLRIFLPAGSFLTCPSLNKKPDLGTAHGVLPLATLSFSPSKWENYIPRPLETVTSDRFSSVQRRCPSFR